MEGLTKKYGLFTAIAMVVGIVIGSGVFFKAESILEKTAGDMPMGILAWLIGGAVMLACIYMFSLLASRYEKVNGVMDYAEAVIGERYAYLMGWFFTVIYYPSLAAVLAWLSARYTLVLFGMTEITGGTCMTLSALYLCISYAVNALSPVAAGKFQVAATIIKLIPLVLMAAVGTAIGASNGILAENFLKSVNMSALLQDYMPAKAPLFEAVVSAAFAYEGWIIATSINAELHNAKRNLPLALISGGIIIISIYILYYIGLAGAINKETLIANGASGVSEAFRQIFGKTGGGLLVVFIIISCFGTLNGLMLGCVRGMYSVASRKRGPNVRLFSQVDEASEIPANSAVFGLLLCAVWLFYFYGANLAEKPLFGNFSFDSAELPIITLYAFYIPIFVMFIKKAKNESGFKRYAAPIAAVAASVFMIIAAVYAYAAAVGYYMLVFVVVMAIGAMFLRQKEC